MMTGNIYSTDDLRVMSSFFNRSLILDHINKKESKIKSYIKMNRDLFNKIPEFFEMTYSDLYDYIYFNIRESYRCEYVYLNEIFLKEVLANHDANHKVLTEVYANKSQADLLIINGTTTVYEIKTELDSLERLDGQLMDYMMFFDNIYVITYPKMYIKLREFLGEKYKSIGIYVLDSDGKLVLKRKSKSHIRYIDKEKVFQSLHSKEIEYISSDYDKAKKNFTSQSNTKVHEYYKNCLYNRAQSYDYLENLPSSLKIVGYKIQNRINNKQKKYLVSKLNRKIKEDL